MNKKQRLLSYLTVFTMIAMLVFPPYTVLGNKHLPKETGYTLISNLSKIGDYYAAQVNTKLLIIQESVIFISFIILLFTFFGKEENSILSILKRRGEKDNKSIPGAI